MTDTFTTTPASGQQPNDLNTPWTLHFDRDGTEDFGIICDADGNDLVASHLPQRMPPKWADREFGDGCFWLPEEEGDSVPLLVHQMQLMAVAPKLLHAVLHVLEASEDGGDMADIDFQLLRDAVAEATDDSIGRAA